MNIIFFHGKLSTPETIHSALAVKIFFNAKGMDVYIPDYKPNDSSKEQIEKFLENYIKENNIGGEFAIIGISLGGYWALNTANKTTAERCILLNPALNYYNDSIKPKNGLPVTCFLNEDDELLDSYKTYQDLKLRCDCQLFKTGGHRMSNIYEILPKIEKTLNRFNPYGLVND